MAEPAVPLPEVMICSVDYCGQRVPTDRDRILEHLKEEHPAAYLREERWPDGEVIWDTTALVEPEDFAI